VLEVDGDGDEMETMMSGRVFSIVVYAIRIKY
jgi:hypothetical protein